MADGKFVRLNGMPLTSQASKNLSDFNAISTVPMMAVPTTANNVTNVSETPIKSLSKQDSDVGSSTDSTSSSEIPLIMPRGTMNLIEPIKEEINLGAILMDDDDLLM